MEPLGFFDPAGFSKVGSGLSFDLTCACCMLLFRFEGLAGLEVLGGLGFRGLGFGVQGSGSENHEPLPSYPRP